MAEREPGLQQNRGRLRVFRGLVGDLLVAMVGREDPLSRRNIDYLQGMAAALDIALDRTNSLNIRLPDGEVYGIGQNGDKGKTKV